MKILNAPNEAHRLAMLRWLWSPGPPSGTLDVEALIKPDLIEHVIRPSLPAVPRLDQNAASNATSPCTPTW